jgi:hypothetical protein
VSGLWRRYGSRWPVRTDSITNCHVSLYGDDRLAVVPLAPRAATNLSPEIGQVHRRVVSIETGEEVGVVSPYCVVACGSWPNNLKNSWDFWC